MNNIKAWIKLSQITKLKKDQIFGLLKLYGEPENFLGKPPEFFEHACFLTDDNLKSLTSITPFHNWDSIRSKIENYKINFMPITSPDYPDSLKEIYQPPLFFFYRGEYNKKIFENTIAIVGTRKPSNYGKIMADKITQSLAAAKFTIVSGLAAGIDSIAHRTCLDNSGSTIAVMGTGCEQVYPSNNRELAKRILDSGCLLISEYLPGVKPEKWFFPQRNRIISGLSRATIVVEGKKNSGALLTAKFALEQNRDVFALPGDINRVQSQGPNYLIKKGAIPITSPDDILDEYQVIGNSGNRQKIELGNGELTVFKLIEDNVPEISFDELLILSGFSLQELSSILFSLEMKSAIKTFPGNKYSIC